MGCKVGWAFWSAEMCTQDTFKESSAHVESLTLWSGGLCLSGLGFSHVTKSNSEASHVDSSRTAARMPGSLLSPPRHRSDLLPWLRVLLPTPVPTPSSFTVSFWNDLISASPILATALLSSQHAGRPQHRLLCKHIFWKEAVFLYRNV